MFKEFPLFPPNASTMAERVDALYFFLVAISLFFSLLIAGLVIFFAIKYRRRPEESKDVKHELTSETMASGIALELTWTIIPFLIAMFIFGWGANIYFSMNRPPAGALDVYAVGKRWMWKVQHAGGQREINELHIPVGRAIKMTMASEDVIHSFYIPAFRLKHDVVPGHYRTFWFEPTKTGNYHLFCAEYCGTKHSQMIGSVVVMEPAEYETWLSGGPTTGSLASAGEKIFNQLGCITCHRKDSTGRGPNIDGVFGKQVQLQSGEIVVAEEIYIRESIVNPGAKVVAGYQPIMPTYQGQITEEGLLQIVAYIKSLGAAQPANAQPSATSQPEGGKKQR
jgi:cytochrome c oxidase subunit 2